ncbi:hypothetical protein D3C80_866670 [compost metagenome]
MQDRAEQGVAVDAVLHRHADVVVLELLAVAEHREGVVLGALGLFDNQVGIALEQADGLEVDLVDHIDLPGNQRVDPRGTVGDAEQFGAGKMSPARLPVVGVAFQRHAHTWLERLDGVAASADAGAPVGNAILAGHDCQVVVSHHIREVGIARVQFEHHAVSAVGTHLGHIAEHGLGRRSRRIAQVMVDRGDHIVDGQALAVMKLHALAQFEGPDPGIGRRRPAFCQLGDGRAIHADFSQGVVHRREADKGEGIGPGTRIKGVGGAGPGQAQAQHAAGLGRRFLGEGIHRQAHGKRSPESACGHAVLEKITAVQHAVLKRLSNLVVVIAHCIAPVDLQRKWFEESETADTPLVGAAQAAKVRSHKDHSRPGFCQQSVFQRTRTFCTRAANLVIVNVANTLTI